MLRIAQLSGDPPSHRGGVGRVVSILREGLTARAHRVDCFSPSRSFAELKPSGVGLQDFSVYDLVHVHGPTPFVSDVICLNPTVKHIVLTYHSDNEWLSRFIAQSYHGVHRLLHSYSDYVLVESDSYRRRYGRSNVPVAVIPPPGTQWEPPGDVLERKPQEFTVLFVGQLRPYKGIPVLLDVARRLPAVKFVIVGTGRLTGSIIDEVSGIPNVELRGTVSDSELFEAYGESHMVCLPSINTSEAFGVTLVEGATLGAVPVASNLPGVNDTIQMLGGETFDVKDSVGLARLVADFCNDRQNWETRARESMGLAASYNKTHTKGWYVSQHEDLFKRIVEK